MAALAVVGLMTSCGTARFYTQAAQGQWRLQRAARPADVVAADPQVDAAVKTKLALVRELRRFAARELGLPANGQYAAYADLGRPYAVWVVFASTEFSVEPHRWWYPLVGSLNYRGFFSEEAAKTLAASLEREGLETHVGGVEAYSTLGWFKDPVLNTFIHRGDVELAELIIHELTHQRLYIRGDTDFNEALATAYADHGVRRWLLARGKADDWRRFAGNVRAERAFVALALEARKKLKASYAASRDLPEAERRARKAAVLERFHREALALRRRHPRLRRIDRWFTQPVNNARLNTLATYYTLVPAFEALLRRHPDDAEAFFREVEKLGKLPKAARREALEALRTGSR